MLDRVLELGMQILPVDRAAVLLTGEAGELVPRALRSRFPIPKDERIWSQGVVEHVLEHGVAALFADAAADPRIVPEGSVLQQGIKGSMATLLQVGDRVFGVMYVDSLRPGAQLKQPDLDLLVGFANQAALALDHALAQDRLRSESVARGRLERFFAPSVVERILGGNGSLDVVEAEVTALLCRISGYDQRISGTMPRAVLDLLSEYFPLAAEAVLEQAGTLERFDGDATLALWGVPFAGDDDADRAVAAAMAMQRAARGRRFELQIGLHTGPVVAGSLGAGRHLHYSAVGRTMTLVRSVCALAQGGEILLSAATAAALVRPPAPLEALPRGALDGHDPPLELHRLAWSRGPAHSSSRARPPAW
jgi:adenylate cyclase